MNLNLSLDDCFKFCEALGLDWSIHADGVGWRARIYEKDSTRYECFGYSTSASDSMINATLRAIERLCTEALRPKRKEL